METDSRTRSRECGRTVKTCSLWDITLSQNIYRWCRITLGVNNVLNFTADRVTFNTTTSPGRQK